MYVLELLKIIYCFFFSHNFKLKKLDCQKRHVSASVILNKMHDYKVIDVEQNDVFHAIYHILFDNIDISHETVLN